jgi:hypothetical protein
MGDHHEIQSAVPEGIRKKNARTPARGRDYQMAIPALSYGGPDHLETDAGILFSRRFKISYLLFHGQHHSDATGIITKYRRTALKVNTRQDVMPITFYSRRIFYYKAWKGVRFTEAEMTSHSKINIVSKLPVEFCNTVTVNDTAYLVQTEDTGLKTCRIISRVYSKGEVVFSRKSDYSHLVALPGFKDRLATLMENQHKNTMGLFLLEQSRKEKSKPEYLEEIQKLLRRGNAKSALTALRHAIDKFPDDPSLLSHYGCLIACVDNNPKEGIKICREAIEKLRGSAPFGTEFLSPVFYLNLGRAYLKDNKKREAITAFLEGLANDPQNRDLLWEMKKMGTRKRPVVPFLARGNPFNRYLGMLLYSSAK